ncbi:MAG: DUF459 domain-containing protein [Rhodobiaceae bacterium]|nr:DUF459 domain-containing protein [Rhodobiaceae bacterium]MCC0040928.1 DUF459 domain-containing protein [Rhodobiaceae bacterium]
MFERRKRYGVSAILGVVALGACLAAASGGRAGAQAVGEPVQLAQVDPLAKFLRGIFGGGRTKRREIPREPARSTTRRTEPAVPQVEVKPKDDDARVVLVLGDSIAAGLAKGLDEAFAEDSTIRIDSISDGSSGLVREDHFDWPGKIDELIGEEGRRINVIIMSVGVNDRQRMRTGGERHQFRSPEWETRYKARITHILDSVTNRAIPIVWVGLPPTSVNKTSNDFLYLNGFFRDGVEDRGMTFVDIWTNFLDENERYSAYGPDVAGQRRLLRRRDGVNFTRAGSRKLAFYVERQIRRLIGSGTLVLLPGLTGQDSGPDPRVTGIGRIVDLTGPIAASGGQLAGGPDEQPFKKDEDSAYQQVVVDGNALPLVGGKPADWTAAADAAEKAAGGEAKAN